MASYPSSMTDSEWEILEPLLPPKPDTLRGRPQENSRRSIVDGILYISRTGGSWRMMPNDLPHWKTCYHYFRLWAKLGYWEQIHHAIRDMARLAVGKKKPRLLRLSIVKAFGQLASPESPGSVLGFKYQDLLVRVVGRSIRGRGAGFRGRASIGPVPANDH